MLAAGSEHSNPPPHPSDPPPAASIQIRDGAGSEAEEGHRSRHPCRCLQPRGWGKEGRRISPPLRRRRQSRARWKEERRIPSSSCRICRPQWLPLPQAAGGAPGAECAAFMAAASHGRGRSAGRQICCPHDRRRPWLYSSCRIHASNPGAGEGCRRQSPAKTEEKVMVEIKPVLEKATREAYTNLHTQAMVVADLGCSSGPNTLHFVSEVIDAIITCYGDDELNQRHEHVQLQFVLNDLPGNDFNNLFRLFAQFKKSKEESHMGNKPFPPYYISGLPGSYYTRLFPCRTVHLFHSLLCLHWRSQVPNGLVGMKKTTQDEGNICIAETSSPSFVKLYQEQFQRDFSLFLRLRYEELVFGGQMVLTFIGRKSEDMLIHGESNQYAYELLAQSLQYLVDEGLVEKKKLKSFYVPVYTASVGEVEDIVKQSGLFDINHLQMFQANWDPYDDDLESNVCHDSVQSGANAAKSFRAVMESLIASHFGVGDTVLDMLFRDFASRVAKHLAVEKTKHAIIVVSLKKAF